MDNEQTKETIDEQLPAMDGQVAIPSEIREEVEKKMAELKQQHKLRKVFAIIVEGESDDDKPYYIAYMRRPDLKYFSQYMSFVQKDLIQANKMLAKNIFIGGDKELIEDDELFLYGVMQQLSNIVESRNSELVKK